ncbi:unnamed protein product [Rotaria sordida]|uniref:Beta-glucuronidase n=1 Tax=Rotaria sordida TaxID=392033 RepID=A0A814GXN7_9BILA|nr:unnamed protein product [Rotaria sordida]
MMWACLLLLTVWYAATHGLLYPAESETRQIRSLNGLWQFRLDEEGVGETERWFAMLNLPQPTILVPVPASYNDITQNITIHRHIGWVWYARDFFIHSTAPRWVLRFQAAHYETHVWVNGQAAMNHSGGHLPFEADITSFIPNDAKSSKMRIVVAINNTLTPTTLPPGELVIHNPTYRELQTHFDFFNYAGIDRSVILYSTSKTYIEDIAIDTQSIDYDSQHIATSAVLNYTVTIGGTNQTDAIRVLIQLLDANGMIVANSTDFQSCLVVNKPNLWEPCGMNHTHLCTEESYLYTLQVTLYNDAQQTDVMDIYRIPHVGIRTVKLTDSKFLINERPFYFHGVNTLEDSEIRGTGFDRVIIAKHFNLYGWIHGNAFRTSPHPYPEEFYHIADRFGIVIIDQTAAIGLNKPEYFSQTTLEHHKQITREMINRDRNHPSVVMWCLANEPQCTFSQSKSYFSALVNFTRSIVAGRPITFVTNLNFNNDQCIEFFDVISLDRYVAWYSDYGRLDQISNIISQDLSNWRLTYPTKPILMSEYGADTMPGLHNDPPFMFTEEYQKDFYSAYHISFDNVSSLTHPDTGYFIGELPWTMFDFATEQSTVRIGALNRKGLFTRQRQPKAAAYKNHSSAFYRDQAILCLPTHDLPSDENVYASIDEFREKVPLTTYKDYTDYIDRMVIEGEKNVLSSEDPVYYSMTSGTTAKIKLLPATSVTIRKINESFVLGFHIVQRSFPSSSSSSFNQRVFTLQTGRKPNMFPTSKDGIPMGPISNLIVEHGGETYALERAKHIRNECSKKNVPGILHRLWPNLMFATTAIGSTFAIYKPDIQFYCGEHLPLINHMVYGSSEGRFGSLASIHTDEYFLLPTHVFFEFIKEEDIEQAQPKTLLISEIEPGHRYELVCTTDAGLVRYRMGDVVNCTRFLCRADDLVPLPTEPVEIPRIPLISLAYRVGSLLDVFGEKANEVHLMNALQQTVHQWKSQGIPVDFCDFTSYPKLDASPAKYVIFLELSEDQKCKINAQQLQILKSTASEEVNQQLSKANEVYEKVQHFKVLDRLDCILVRSGTFSTFLRKFLWTSRSSPTQIKPHRILKNEEHIRFFYDNQIDTSLS